MPRVYSETRSLLWQGMPVASCTADPSFGSSTPRLSAGAPSFLLALAHGQRHLQKRLQLLRQEPCAAREGPATQPPKAAGYWRAHRAASHGLRGTHGRAVASS